MDNTDVPVAIEILVETALERLQRSARSRRNADIGRVIAVLVGGPDRILIGAHDLPGDLISAGRRLRADRYPTPGYARHIRQIVGTGNLQRWRDRTCAGIKIILISNLGQTNRAFPLDHYSTNYRIIKLRRPHWCCRPTSAAVAVKALGPVESAPVV